MNFGMPTLAELDSIEDNARLCSKLKLDFVELNMNLPECQVDVLDAEELNVMKEKYGIYFTIHLDERLDVCDFNRNISEGYVKTVRDTIRLAEKIGAPVLNMHFSGGIYFTLPDRKLYLYEKYGDYYFDKLEKFSAMCKEEAGGKGISICIENTDGYAEYLKRGIEKLLENDVFSLTYDVGHDYCIGVKDYAFVEEHIERLKHIHLHDAEGKSCHLPIGTGKLDIDEKLRLAEKCGCRIVIEVKTEESLTKSVKSIAGQAEHSLRGF